METILSGLNKFEKVGTKKGILNLSINHEKYINRDMKNQGVCLPNNIKKLKLLEVEK